MPKKKTCGKNTQIIISFGRENGLEPNFYAITQDSKFFWSDSSFSQPPSDENIFTGSLQFGSFGLFFFWKFVWENWAQFQQ